MIAYVGICPENSLGDTEDLEMFKSRIWSEINKYQLGRSRAHIVEKSMEISIFSLKIERSASQKVSDMPESILEHR